MAGIHTSSSARIIELPASKVGDQVRLLAAWRVELQLSAMARIFDGHSALLGLFMMSGVFKRLEYRLVGPLSVPKTMLRNGLAG